MSAVHEHTKHINDMQMYKDQTMFVTASKDHTAKVRTVYHIRKFSLWAWGDNLQLLHTHALDTKCTELVVIISCRTSGSGIIFNTGNHCCWIFAIYPFITLFFVWLGLTFNVSMCIFFPFGLAFSPGISMR